MESGTEIHGKNLIKDIDQKYYCSDYYDVSVKCRTSLRLWETGQVEDWKMMKDKLIDGKEL